MQEIIKHQDTNVAMVNSISGLDGKTKIKGTWTLKAFDPEGNLVREEEWSNLVTTQGMNYLLGAGLASVAAITAWYVGLAGTTPTPAAADTLASHAGWTEVTAYSETVRQTWTPGSVSAASVDNSASKATFTVNANSTTIGGAFLASNSTKSGTTGTLYSIGAFTGGDLVLNSGSSIQVTATFSLS